MKKLCGNSLRLVLLTALLAVAAGLQAQVRGNSIVVTVEPDSKDWNYKVGQTAVFTVEVPGRARLSIMCQSATRLGLKCTPRRSARVWC